MSLTIRTLGISLLIVSLLDLLLALAVVHDNWFQETTFHVFLLTALDTITARLGQLVLLVVAVAAVITAARGAPVSPEEITRLLWQHVLGGIRATFTRPAALQSADGMAAVVAVVLIWIFLVGPRFYPSVTRAASAILATANGEIWVADSKQGVVVVFDAKAPHQSTHTIRIGQEIAERWRQGTPERLFDASVKLNAILAMS